MSALGTQKLWAVRGRARSAFEISDFTFEISNLKFEMLRQWARICLPAIVGIRWQICQTPRQRIFADLREQLGRDNSFRKWRFASVLQQMFERWSSYFLIWKTDTHFLGRRQAEWSSTRASTATVQDFAPAALRTLAASEHVAPVVRTSSTIRMRWPWTVGR